jgi:hypothetical protein
MLNLWKIERNEVGYDENYGHVIAAHEEKDVREIAAKVAADEGEGPWFDPERSKAVLIGKALETNVGYPGIILTSFNAG